MLQYTVAIQSGWSGDHAVCPVVMACRAGGDSVTILHPPMEGATVQSQTLRNAAARENHVQVSILIVETFSGRVWIHWGPPGGSGLEKLSLNMEGSWKCSHLDPGFPQS